jgi:hypothetical protein
MTKNDDTLLAAIIDWTVTFNNELVLFLSQPYPLTPYLRYCFEQDSSTEVAPIVMLAIDLV